MKFCSFQRFICSYQFIYSISIVSASSINLLHLIAVTVRRSVTYVFLALFVLKYTLDELL